MFRGTPASSSDSADAFEGRPVRTAEVLQRAWFLERRSVLRSIGYLLQADDVVERGDQDAQTVDFELRRVLDEMHVAH